MATSPQELIDTNIRHATFVSRFAGGLSNNFDTFLESLRKDIAFRLSLGSDFMTVKQFNKMVADINKTQNDIYSAYEKELFSDLRGFSGHEADFEVGSLSKIAPKFDFKSAPTSKIWAAVNAVPLILTQSQTATLLAPFIKNWVRKEKLSVARIIRFGFLAGRTISEITRDISGKGGYLDKRARANNRAIVRTSVNHSSATARRKTYTDNSDIVIGYTIIATLDNRTSNICRGYDHVSIKFTDAKQPEPPLHVNCRSTTVPLLDDRFKFDDGTSLRGSVGVDGRTQTSANTTYYQWLKNQGNVAGGRKFVFETIGRERGKLLLDGGLSADEFKSLTTSKDGLFRPINLNDLKKKDSLSSAFDRANISIDG